MIGDLKKRFKAATNIVQQRIGQRDALLLHRNGLNKSLETNVNRLNSLIEAKRLLEIFVKSTEAEIRKKYEPTITEALSFVFSKHLYFHLYLVERRNQSEVDFIILRSPASEQMYQEFISKGDTNRLETLVKETKNINYMYGGAVNQVVSLILRFINAELLKIKGPIVLDEPSSMVGEEFSARLGQLISSLSAKFNRQYIMITHSRSLSSYAHKVYEINQHNFISQAMELL